MRFGSFVRRALEDAKVHRGWNQARVIRETGIGKTTMHRWLTGDWSDYPELANVRRFCQTLDIPVEAAFAALGIGEKDTPPADELPPLPPDFVAVLRRLNDPNVPEAEKTIIRATMRHLARGGLE